MRKSRSSRRAWTTRGRISKAVLGVRRAYQARPCSSRFKIYLGGGSRPAWELSAKHSDVHLFWGDLPERIAANIAEIRMARAHGRENDIGFSMRLR
jgi:alkanesulfonate monooxygenase